MLLAEDSHVARQSITSFLGTLEGIELSGACQDGRAAVEAALADPPDIALLDLQMPVMSGLEAAEVFRSCLPETAVIMMTVHDHPEVRMACLGGGADAFVPKSSLVRQFDAALEQALAAAAARVRGMARDRAVSGFQERLPFSPSPVTRGPGENDPAGAVDSKDEDRGLALPLDKSAPSLRRVSSPAEPVAER
jgi:DNA-binding NarL/FixJ family response regulator